MRVFEKTRDRITGEVTTVGSQDGKLVVHTDQDVGAALDYAKALRNDADYAKLGIKKSWMHAAHIPNVVVLKMKLEDGFDCMTAHPKEIVQFLNKNKAKYGYLFAKEGVL
jgi:hypothetical protein